jgi:hypothetical protein
MTTARDPLEIRDRVLEPFFTTKSRGGGLGLPIAKRSAELHGGVLSFMSDSGWNGGDPDVADPGASTNLTLVPRNRGCRHRHRLKKVGTGVDSREAQRCQSRLMRSRG